MKLPFEFGVKLFFRILLPGFFLTVGLSPVLFTLWDWVGQTFHPYGIRDEIAFALIVILMGWVILICDMPIYMLFEGRRFWPKPIRSWFLKSEEKRLRSIKDILKTIDENDNRYIEASVELRTFPIDEDGEYVVRYPSRLGNLIMAYETYSNRMYGMSGVFYWNRIWLKLDKDVRDDLDAYQAVADSSIYTSFALFIDGLLCIVYAMTSMFPMFHVLFPKYFPSPVTLLSMSFMCFIFAYGIYVLSLYVQEQFGGLIKSMFDVHRTKIDENISAILDEIIDITGDPSLRKRPRREKYSIVSYYLNYYRVLCPECNDYLPPLTVKTHLKSPSCD